jgi:hypothetical protein
MFRRDIGLQDILPPGPLDALSLLKVHERNQDVVAGIELQHAGSHGVRRPKKLDAGQCKRLRNEPQFGYVQLQAGLMP